jgi:carbamoyl-phosphate synthase large subunit
MSPTINVLFTSAGRRVELLRAFREAYAALQLEGHIIALDIDPLAPALQLADRPYIVPRLNTAAYIPTLLEICRREQVSLIFPLIDPDIPLLAQHRAAIEATGAKLAVVPYPAAQVAADKWQTTQFFQQLGLATPRSWLPEQLEMGAPTYPLFIKPRRGSAAKNAFRVENERELSFFLEYVPEPIIQECISGPEITNDVICNVGGELWAVVSRRRIEVRWGEVAKGITIYDPTITNACAAIAEALPALGPITVQCLMKGDIPYFTEINARLGGGVPLGIAAGANSPRWLLAKAAGIEETIPPLGSYQTGLYMTRFDDSYWLTHSEYERLAAHSLNHVTG